jgi:hypothetical protein
MTAGKALGLFWATDTSPGTDELRHVNVAFPCDGQWHEVAFDLSAHAYWRGLITVLRLDPEPAEVPVGTELEVDWIRGQ